MILRAQRIFDLDMPYLDREHASDFIGFIAKDIKRELVTKFLNELGDHKIYFVRLHEPELIEDLPETWNVAYRQNLEFLKIVQCKDCRMHFPWCQKFKSELGGKGFCPYGWPIGADDE